MTKERVHELVEQMPEQSMWDDLIRKIYVRDAIEQGLADSQTGRTKNVKEVRAKYGLSE